MAIREIITIDLVADVRQHLETGEYCNVVLSSDGGNTIAGIRIGRLFREHGIRTQVKAGQACSSICASMFLGGVQRRIRTNAELFFHAPYNLQIGQLRCNRYNSYVVRQLKQYTIDMIGDVDGREVHRRTMKYCSRTKGWTIKSNSQSKRYGISTR